MWTFILSEFGPWLLGAGAALVGIAFAYLRGRGDGKKLERTKITEGELRLRKAYDETNSRPIDHDAAFGELRERSKR